MPVLPRINKLGEKVAWEHRFDEPNGSSAGRPPETQSRREARYLQLPAQCGSRDMLMFWLGPHTKPQRRLDLRQLGERIRHGRKIWRVDHTGAVLFFKRPRRYVVLLLNLMAFMMATPVNRLRRDPAGIKSRAEVFPCSANCFCSSLSKPVFLSGAQPLEPYQRNARQDCF